MREENSQIETKAGFKLQARIIKNKDIDAVFEAKDIIEEAHKTAEKIKIEAQQEAKEFLEETRQKTQQIIKDAKQQAEEKEKIILADAQKKAASEASKEILHIVASLRSQLESSNELISKLIIEVAHKVLGKFEKSDLFTKMIHTGIADLQGQTGLIIRVNPSDEEFARNAIETVNHSSGKGPIERLETDTSLQEGSCYILNEGGLLDISLECQLRNIVEELDRIRERRRE